MTAKNIRQKKDTSSINQLDLSELETFHYFYEEVYDGFKSSEYYFTELLRQLMTKHEMTFTIENRYPLKVQLANDIVKSCQIDIANHTS